MSYSTVAERKQSRASGEKERGSYDVEEGEAGAPGASGPDIAVIRFGPEDEELLRIKKGEHITIDRPWKSVPKLPVLQVLERMEKMRAVRRLKNYDFDEVLIGFQAALSPAEGHLVCLTDRGRQRVLEELAHLHTTLADKVREYLVRSSSVGPRPVAEAPAAPAARPPITYEWAGLIESRQVKKRFVPGPPSYTRILDRRKELTLVERCVQDVGVEATPALSNAAVQTEPEISVNDATQFVPEIDLPSSVKLSNQEMARLAEVCKGFKQTVLEATGYNSLFDLYKDDYGELLAASSPLTIATGGSYTHYMSFNDISQFEGKILTCLSWHPGIPGAVAVAYGNLSANNTVKLDSDSEDENYKSRGGELDLWTKTRKVVTVEDKDTSERDAWMKTVKRLDHLVGLEYSEEQWTTAETTLDAIEAAVRLREFEVHAQKNKEDLVPFYDAGPEEYDMYYLPYGASMSVDSNLIKNVITYPPEDLS